MGNVRPVYLSKLLQPVIFSLEGTLTSRFKIIEGRLFLWACQTFTPGSQRPSPSSLTDFHPSPCYHLRFAESEGRSQKEIQVAYDMFQHCEPTSDNTIRTQFSCKFCPTDVELQIGADYATFSVWCDLGTGQYPYGKCWSSRGFENALDPAVFEYKHVSIQETYERAL